MSETNPLLAPWNGPLGLPRFDDIATEQFRPAFDSALAENRREIAAITENGEAPSFANTIAAMERSGHALDRVSSVFFNLVGTDTDDTLQAIEQEMAPILSRHSNAIYLDDALFARIDTLWTNRDTLGLDDEEMRVLERYHTKFRRAGAGRPPAAKERIAAIRERLSTLGTTFSNNVLADEKSWMLELDGADDLAGLPDFLVSAAGEAARERGRDGHVITLSRSLIEPFLQFSDRRDLREKAFAAWTARGENGGATDNRAIIAETIALRAELGKLLGYESFAEYRLADSMAKTPEAVTALLQSVWNPARRRAIAEREALEKLAASRGDDVHVEAWDWRYYTEKRRKDEFDLDENALKPYLALDTMIAAAFDTASRLFGVTFTERKDVSAYHPDVRVFEVHDMAGKPVGVFLGDYFARPSKRSGAWMNAWRSQEKLSGDIRPIIVNVMNFARGAKGKPTLLSFDDARTLFHEFGHALHGLLSDVTYPSLAGTNVERDFVEFPSQLYEHWLEQPEVLERFARHVETNEPMPRDLLGRLIETLNFNQGFATVEYVSSALVDLEMHRLTDTSDFDPTTFEHRVLDELGMPRGIVMRHRPPHFQHVFSGDGYSSAYYSYLWSEVLDADGFDAFTEAGDIFAPDVAERLGTFVYSAGGRRDPALAYRKFRGRDPDPSALLRQRDLAEA